MEYTVIVTEDLHELTRFECPNLDALAEAFASVAENVKAHPTVFTGRIAFTIVNAFSAE